jgi:hypothetical protein
MTSVLTLGANEVVARGNVSWNLEEDLATVVVHIFGAPPLRVARDIYDK